MPNDSEAQVSPLARSVSHTSMTAPAPEPPAIEETTIATGLWALVSTVSPRRARPLAARRSPRRHSSCACAWSMWVLTVLRLATVMSLPRARNWPAPFSTGTFTLPGLGRQPAIASAIGGPARAREGAVDVPVGEPGTDEALRSRDGAAEAEGRVRCRQRARARQCAGTASRAAGPRSTRPGSADGQLVTDDTQGLAA